MTAIGIGTQKGIVEQHWRAQRYALTGFPEAVLPGALLPEALLPGALLPGALLPGALENLHIYYLQKIFTTSSNNRKHLSVLEDFFVCLIRIM